jgi:hypothetical protein
MHIIVNTDARYSKDVLRSIFLDFYFLQQHIQVEVIETMTGIYKINEVQIVEGEVVKKIFSSSL